MTQSNNNELTLADINQVLSKLDHIEQRLGKLEQEMRETNNRVKIDQKASTQVVNLAFSLIASATVTIIITSVFRK